MSGTVNCTDSIIVVVVVIVCGSGSYSRDGSGSGYGCGSRRLLNRTKRKINSSNSSGNVFA